jgi:hypothetical protein
MKKMLLLLAVGLIAFTSSIAAQTPPVIEFFYGEIEAVNVGFYNTDPINPIFCAVQVGGVNEKGTDIKSTPDKMPILVVTQKNTRRYEILAQLISAQANGLKVHLFTLSHKIELNNGLGSILKYNELVEISVGKIWQRWEW